MKKFIVLSAVLVLLIGSGSNPPTHAQGKGKQVSKLMAEKLKHSQTLLEGISIADFKKIEVSAEALLDLTRSEEWLMNKSAKYQTHTNEFRRAAETLIRKAKDKNIDGTTLAFFDMTMSCVRCHQYVREVRDARLSTDPMALVRRTEP